MGNNKSYSKEEVQAYLENEASKRFNLRIRSYSYPHHGPYPEYVEACRALYRLECIPENCHQGPSLKLKYDYYDYF